MKTSQMIRLMIAGLCLALLSPVNVQADGDRNDFNGDNISDLAVFYPPAGTWYVGSRTGTIHEWGRQWGYPTSLPVPADYNNSGSHDLAVYDKDGGYWYIMDRDGTIISWAFQWGWSTAVPVPADYDNDGYTDLGVYDLETGFWYVYSLQKSQILMWESQWGFKGDVRSWEDPNSTAIPVPFDYDQDGIVDRAIYWRGFDMFTSGWWIEGTAGQDFMHPTDLAGAGWGSSSSIPAPGNYRDEVPENPYPEGLCVYRLPQGEFFTPYMHGFTLSSYHRTLPIVASDFDGNGYDDHAIYDYVNGIWSIYYNDWDGNGAPPLGQVYEQPPTEFIVWGFAGAIPANIYSSIYKSCGYEHTLPF